MKEKVNFIVAPDLSPLNNRINFIIVNCLQNIFINFNLRHFRSKTTVTLSMDTNISFLDKIMGNSPEIIHFET